MKRYYQLVESAESADLYIYGDITSYPYFESDVSAAPLVKEIDAVKAIQINVYINSYGGEVAEALAIISALERNPAKVTTFCDGFACSAAANIFMAGESRIMSPASVLMIHNAWMYAAGDPEALHKQADDLDTINDAAIKIYLSKINITEAKLRALMDDETWITPDEAIAMGFATGIAQDTPAANQSAMQAVMRRVIEARKSEPIINVQIDAEAVGAALESVLSKYITKPLAVQPDTTNVQRLMMALFS